MVWYAGLEDTTKDKLKFIYSKNPNHIPIKYRELIENSRGFIEKKKIVERDKIRWDDFNTVVERLNSPELIDYYERRRFKYHYARGYGEDYSDVVYVFKYNKGHCAQITAFTKYVLQKAGYKAYKLIIYHPAYASPRGNHHRVCLFKVNGRKYIMDNGRTRQFGIIPYDEYDIEHNPFLYEAIWDELKESGTN